jgi:hypothetical protein
MIYRSMADPMPSLGHILALLQRAEEALDHPNRHHRRIAAACLKQVREILAKQSTPPIHFRL